MKDKHEFRIVLDGAELDTEQIATIENAIREAVLLATSRLPLNGTGVVTVDPRISDRLKWRGIWILAGKPAQQLVDQNQKSVRG